MLMRVQQPDFHYVPSEHKAIDARLENWSAYVRVKFPSWVSPIWKLGKSNGRQWHTPEYRAACDMLDGMRLEKAVYALPDLHREALRWAYVFQYGEGRFRKKHGLIKKLGDRKTTDMRADSLYQVLQDARNMLINRRV
jgi:hypothetical protein